MGRFIDTFLGKTSTPEPEPQQDGYKENATDRDGDGLVQDGTPFERPSSIKTTRKKVK